MSAYDRWLLSGVGGPYDEGEFEDDDEETGTVDSEASVEADQLLAGLASGESLLPRRAPDSDVPY